MDKRIFTDAGFKGRGKNFHRIINDVFQLINFQPSNYSNDIYTNVAIWPLALGEPTCLLEHKFPIRGRIENFVSAKDQSSEEMHRSLLDALAGHLSSLSKLQQEKRNGALEGIYLSLAARNLLDSINPSH